MPSRRTFTEQEKTFYGKIYRFMKEFSSNYVVTKHYLELSSGDFDEAFARYFQDQENHQLFDANCVGKDDEENQMILKWIRLGIAPWEPDFYLEEEELERKRKNKKDTSIAEKERLQKEEAERKRIEEKKRELAEANKRNMLEIQQYE